MKLQKTKLLKPAFIAVMILIAGSLAAQTAYVNYAEALQKSLYFYDAEKCGLTTPNRLEWRGPCHTTDEKVALDTTSTDMSAEFIAANRSILDPDGDGFMNVIGGYHDAGDHVQFGLPQGYSASTLGWGLNEYKQSFIDIGEYNHMLEIMKYFTDFFIRCTFKNSAGNVVAFVYQTGDGARDHVFWGPPEFQTLTTSARPIYVATSENPASDQCGEAAAALAIMYLNYNSVDAAYAATCLNTAKALYAFGVAYRGLGFSGGFYGSSADEDELSWAATWLYAATGITSYIDDIMKTDALGNYSGYLAKIVINPSNDWQNAWVHCWDAVWGGVFVKLATLFPTNTLYDYYARWNIEYWSGGQVPHQNPADGNYLRYTPGGYGMINSWGSCRYNTAAQLCGLVYAKSRGRTDIPAWAKGQMTYIMGANPLSRSYIVGYGNNPVMHPHHRAAHGSLTLDMNDPPNHKHTLWGALAGGPDGADYHIDITTDYSYNEVAIDYNAAFVGCLAAFYELYGKAAGHEPIAVFPILEGDVEEYWVEAKIDNEDAKGTQIELKIHVEAVHPPRYESGIKCRYYFNISEIIAAGGSISSITTQIYYDQQAILNGGPNTVINGPYAYDAANGLYFIEIDWTTALISGSRELMFVILVTQDYTGGTTPVWNGANDYSRQGLIATYARTNYIPVYNDGLLESGIPMGSSNPTASPTRTATTVTRTATATTVSRTATATTVSRTATATTVSRTATATRTSTTLTRTATATRTSTTLTRTATTTATTVTRTATATTVTRTATATATTVTSTGTATRTSTTVTRTGTATATTVTRTATGTTVTRTATSTSATPTPGTGCTCDAGCSTLTVITPNYTKEGVGQFCFEAVSLGTYINSWNLATLKVNGVDFTNKWTSVSSLPAQIGGKYYVYYNSTLSYGHFEAMN